MTAGIVAYVTHLRSDPRTRAWTVGAIPFALTAGLSRVFPGHVLTDLLAA